MRSRKDRMRARVRRPRMRRRLSDLSFNRMVPNVLTLLALCAGMTAIRFAINGDFQAAVFAIIAAGIFDGLDGRLARLLKATTQFGAELDSLADFISFGVAPAAVLYLWTMAQLHSVGWAIVLFYAVCCALRLARFNTQLAAEPSPPWAANFFSGAPAPAGSRAPDAADVHQLRMGRRMGRLDRALALPQRGVDQRRRADDGQHRADGVIEAHPHSAPFRWHTRTTLLGIGVMAGFFTTAPWPTLTFVGAVYLASIPLTIRAAAQARRGSPRRANGGPRRGTGLWPLSAAAVALPLGEAQPPASEWRH